MPWWLVLLKILGVILGIALGIYLSWLFYWMVKSAMWFRRERPDLRVAMPPIRRVPSIPESSSEAPKYGSNFSSVLANLAAEAEEKKTKEERLNKLLDKED